MRKKYNKNLNIDARYKLYCLMDIVGGSLQNS